MLMGWAAPRLGAGLAAAHLPALAQAVGFGQEAQGFMGWAPSGVGMVTGSESARWA